MSDRLQSIMRMCLLLAVGSVLSVGCAMPKARHDPDSIPLPKIPDRTFNIVDYGAVGDGKTVNTEAITKAIQACSAAGGGKLVVPKGTFLTGPIVLASNLNLHLEKGAVLLATDDIDTYPMRKNRYVDWITANDAHDIAITGPGTIHGNGRKWWTKYRKRKFLPPGEKQYSEIYPHRPHMIVLKRCERVLVEDVLLTHSPMFHLIPESCRDVVIRNIRIISPDEGGDTPNTDGIDPSGWNILITDCYITTSDDNIAIKPSARRGPNGEPSCQNITIRNCTFGRGHGLSIGGQTPNGLENLVVRDCRWEGTEHGFRCKANRKSGGLVENITLENLTMKNVGIPILIYSYYDKIPPAVADDKPQEITATTPIWRNIRIKNLKATGADIAGQIIGLPEMPITDVVLSNVTISARTGLELVNTRQIKLENTRILVKEVTGNPTATPSPPPPTAPGTQPATRPATAQAAEDQ